MSAVSEYKQWIEEARENLATITHSAGVDMFLEGVRINDTKMIQKGLVYNQVIMTVYKDNKKVLDEKKATILLATNPQAELLSRYVESIIDGDPKNKKQTLQYVRHMIIGGGMTYESLMNQQGGARFLREEITLATDIAEFYAHVRVLKQACIDRDQFIMLPSLAAFICNGMLLDLRAKYMYELKQGNDESSGMFGISSGEVLRHLDQMSAFLVNAEVRSDRNKDYIRYMVLSAIQTFYALATSAKLKLDMDDVERNYQKALITNTNSNKV